jgi:hypothetical protein
MNKEISNSDDVIDSRDVIARIEELREERDDLQIEFDEANETHADEDNQDDRAAAYADVELAAQALKEWDESEEAEELNMLESLASEAEGYAADWQHGATLIRDSYFKEYAQELAEDIGAIDSNASWPNTCIDWDQAARELQTDYTSVEFGNVTYWVR